MIIDIFNTDNKYDLILADPPWQQMKGGKKSVRPNSSGGNLSYPTISLKQISYYLICREQEISHLYRWWDELRLAFLHEELRMLSGSN